MKEYIKLDITDLHSWGFSIVDKILKKYLDESVVATSCAYMHGTLLTFSTEVLNEDAEGMAYYTQLLSKDYSQAFKEYQSPDYQERIAYLWQEYKEAVRREVSKVLTIDPQKTYTCEILKNNILTINTVDTTFLMQSSIVEIF